MPAPIAALTSMRGTAKPITRDERKARVEKARRLMTEHKIAGLPVVDEKGAVIGIITESDLLRMLVTKLREIEEVGAAG